MLINENNLIHFENVKNYFADTSSVLKISTPGFEIDINILNTAIKKADYKPNIYGLFVKKPSEIYWSLKYIGQRDSVGIQQRLREHLIYANGKTGSKLDKIKLALSQGYEVGVKHVTIMPENFRFVYEANLIQEFRDILEWNIQGGKSKIN